MGQISDDDLTAPALSARGIEVETRCWQEALDWSRYQAAVIRSTWDYFRRPVEFLSKLKEASCPLFNSVEAVEWNLRKSYLRDVPVPTIPTHYHQDPGKEVLAEYLDLYGEVVVKPVIAAGGFDTYRIAPETPLPVLTGQDWMIQPLVPSIHDRGEISLIYFEGRFSHAVRKVPAGGEFRIQLIHGGRCDLMPDPPGEALEVGAQTLAGLPFELLYARVDLVFYQGRYVLMEVELIEPSLYFEWYPPATERFAASLSRYLS